MFTGIIEALGKIESLQEENSNLHLTLSSPFTQELQVDQSVAHNGVCLTVVDIKDTQYTVTAIQETLDKSNLSDVKTGDVVNLERCTKIGSRLDGHIVQGHVDQTAICTSIENKDGSWKFNFQYKPDSNHVTVQKGSICINGVSLTVVDSEKDSFSVAIIPFTYEHTSFRNLKVGDRVNLEFDIIGKYVARLMEMRDE